MYDYFRTDELYPVQRRTGIFGDQQRTRYHLSIMNTSQLECCIESDPALRSYVIGVYAADHLPNRGFHQPYGLIVNTDIHSKSGQHWVAIYDNGHGQMDFFDSYARSPGENSVHIMQWINRRYKSLIVNRKRIQSDYSSVCGLYCLYYLRQRLLGESMEDILNRFNSDIVSYNDFYIYDVMTKAYSMCFENMCTYNQTCRPLIKL